jgi:hypothetical protein
MDPQERCFVPSATVDTDGVSGGDLLTICRHDRPDFEDHHTLTVAKISMGTKVRALGYMMDADQPVRDGERVRRFILLPDAGNVVHPAHRFGDETISGAAPSGQ